MATLKSTLLFLARRGKPLFCQRQRYAAYWNKNWKPGPIPRTPEERAAAAKKYGLRPEDYNCLADNEVGDYPHLPIVAQSWKDPYEDYDMPGERRNYGEPIHHDSEFIGMEMWDPNARGRYTYPQMVLIFSLTIAGLVGVFWLFQDIVLVPQMPQQHPFNELYLEKGGDPALEKEVKHYTFEPAE